jgi:hypothetical protein
MEQAVFQEVAAYDFGGPGYNLTGVRPVQVFLAAVALLAVSVPARLQA